MRITNKFARFCLLFCSVLCCFSCFCIKNTETTAFAKDFNSTTSSEIVMEKTTNRVLYGSNIHEKKYMASTTKILTAIVIIENCNLDDIVTVTAKTVGVEGSSIYLEAGEKLSVKDLLFGLMLRSGNDCAETLAVYCSGSIENFARLMNETATRIGATESHFVNPHGLNNDNHYTTAYDLALISCYAIRNETFKEIVSTQKTRIPFSTHDTERVLINKNKMLKEFEGSTGIKTGFTKKAGRCLVSSCERNGMELVSVVLNCGPMFERSKTILQSGFDDYEMCRLVSCDEIIDFIPVENTDTTCAAYIKNDVVVPLNGDEKNNVEIKYELPETVGNDFVGEREIGFIKIYCKNNLIFTQKIYTIL